MPCGLIYEASDILADPHFMQRQMLQTFAVDIGAHAPQPVTFPGVVPVLQKNPGATRWLGPELGQHTEEVLNELGINHQEQQRLRQQGVL